MKSELKKLLLGFLNPGLSGGYVLLGVLSAVAFGIHYYGYASWLRTGPFFGASIILICILILAVVSAGWLQVQIWRRVFNQTEASKMPWRELLSRTLIVAFVVLPLSAGFGAKIREIRAYRICRNCNVLISDLESGKKVHGTYTTNAVALVRENNSLHRKYLFYYGLHDTNGVEWDPSDIAQADVSLFVSTNDFQIVVPIERMSPITFSSFYVYSYTSEHPFWNKTKLHWSLDGSYFDDVGR